MNSTLPPRDLIVTEIHAIREHLAEQYQDDLLAYSHATEEHCRALGFHTIESPRLQRSSVEVAKAGSG